MPVAFPCVMNPVPVSEPDTLTEPRWPRWAVPLNTSVDGMSAGRNWWCLNVPWPDPCKYRYVTPLTSAAGTAAPATFDVDNTTRPSRDSVFGARRFVRRLSKLICALLGWAKFPGPHHLIPEQGFKEKERSWGAFSMIVRTAQRPSRKIRKDIQYKLMYSYGIAGTGPWRQGSGRFLVSHISIRHAAGLRRLSAWLIGSSRIKIDHSHSLEACS